MTIHHCTDNDQTACGKWAGLVYEYSADKGSVTCPDCLDGRPTYATHGLPDPNLVGECQVQSSPFCDPGAGRQRMNPTDMLQADTSFRAYADMCDPCHDHQADAYLHEIHTDPRHAHLFTINREA